jgi:hypothetical protein
MSRNDPRFNCFAVSHHREHTELFDVFVEVPEMEINGLDGIMFKDITSGMAYAITNIAGAAYKMGLRHGAADEKARIAAKLGLNRDPEQTFPYDFERLAKDIKTATVMPHKGND